MTREKKEQLSNRLVLNFGILLAAGLILLYVNSALRSGVHVSGIAYTVILAVGIISLVLGVYLLAYGKTKNPAVTNYSGICLGTLIGSALLYVSKFNIIPNYTKTTAIITVYILMAVYFIVLAIITGIQLRKPVIKSNAQKIVHAKKKRR